MKRVLVVTGVLLTTIFGAHPAYAQRSGFAVDRFEPSERGSQFFANDTLDFRGDARPALGAVLDYGYKPLVAYAPNGDEKSAIVRHQLVTHFGGSLVLADRVRLGVNVPVSLYQDGELAVVNGDAFVPADKPALGDIRLAADVRLLGKKNEPVTIAIGLRGWLPTGVRGQFTSDGSLRIGPQAMVAGDIGVLTYAARLAFVYRPRDDAYAGSSLGSEVTGGAAVGIKVLNDRLVAGPEIFASSVTSGDAFFKTRGSPAEWLFGAHYDVVPGIRVGAGVGSGLTRGYGAPEVRALGSFEWAPAYVNDRDLDGVPDDEDACADVAGIRTSDPKTNGCPPPPADRDGDGIPDLQDACIDVKGVADPDPKKNGCPSDRDADGIYDMQDACIDVKGVADPDPKKNGCPSDRDSDGVYDTEDACPDKSGVRTTDPKTNGCPPPPADTDGDGILDTDDACPLVAGPRNADPKKNGCPLVIITEKEIKITEQVKFKFNSAELLKESDTILDAVRQTLVDHPELTKLRIEGHTDNVGNKDYNKQLSQKRAASVMKWLTDHGIDKMRLASEGFGMEEPIETNATEEGRANNRRVAFTITAKDESKRSVKP